MSLAIEDCSAEYIKSIASIPHLERLHIHYHGRLKDTTVFNDLNENDKIRDVILCGLPATALDYVVRQCPRIARLRIELSEVSHATLEQFRRMKELKDISFLYCDLPNADAEGVLSLPVTKIAHFGLEQLFDKDGPSKFLTQLQQQAGKSTRPVVLDIAGIDRQQLTRLSQFDHIESLLCAGNLQFNDVKPMKAKSFKIGSLQSTGLFSTWNDQPPLSNTEQ